MGETKTLRCTFCGRWNTQVVRMIAGPSGIGICNECTDICVDVMAQENAPIPTLDQARADLAAWRSLAHDLAAELQKQNAGEVKR